MGDLTRNFDLKDFRCHCNCGLNHPHPLLVCGVQTVRDRLMSPVIITSAARCDTWNRLTLGGIDSRHKPQGEHHEMTMAADLVCHGALLYTMFNAAESVEQFKDGGIGLYLTRHDDGSSTRFMHVDCRGWKARWFMLDGEGVDVSTLLTADAGRPIKEINA